MVYGEKNTGKTAILMGLPGPKAFFQLDEKSIRTKTEMFNESDDITVYEVTRYWDMQNTMVTSAITVDYFRELINHLVNRKVEYDWVIVDGLSILSEIGEMKMRYDCNLGEIEGTKNRNVWKLRKRTLRGIRYLLHKLAKKGVIWTTYTEKSKIIKDGEVVTEKDVPAWMDVIMWATDVVIKTEMFKHKGGTPKFTAHCEASKSSKFIETGKYKDVTDKPESFWKGEE